VAGEELKDQVMTNQSCTRLIHHMRTYILLMTFLAVGGCCAIAQGNGPSPPLDKQIVTPAAASTVDASPSFDVVSIKPDNTGKHGNAGFLNDTYVSNGYSLWETIMRAYFPATMRSVVHIGNLPSWVPIEQFDIVAKVDADTAARLQPLTFRERDAIVQPMLQKMLAERCGLTIHRAPEEVEGYALTVGRRGSKLQQSQPSDVVPQGVRTIGEGLGKIRMISKPGSHPEIDFYGASTATLAEHLSLMRGILVFDQTGLKGAYNFQLIPWDEGPAAGDGSMQGDNHFENIVPWDLGRLGLQLKQIKVKTETIVIDSIHRPTPN
jgi:uncharacterized protein (TIGR03435 family)